MNTPPEEQSLELEAQQKAFAKLRTSLTRAFKQFSKEMGPHIQHRPTEPVCDNYFSSYKHPNVINYLHLRQSLGYLAALYESATDANQVTELLKLQFLLCYRTQATDNASLWISNSIIEKLNKLGQHDAAIEMAEILMRDLPEAPQRYPLRSISSIIDVYITVSRVHGAKSNLTEQIAYLRKAGQLCEIERQNGNRENVEQALADVLGELYRVYKQIGTEEAMSEMRLIKQWYQTLDDNNLIRIYSDLSKDEKGSD